MLVLMLFNAALAKAQPTDASAPTQQEKAIHYSLYYEDFKNANYEGALPNLRWILKNAPEFQGNRKTDKNYKRAVTVFENIAKVQDSPEMKKAYLDSALYIFDTAVPSLKDRGVDANLYEWTLNKGNFIITHSDDLPDEMDKAGVIFLKAWSIDPAQMQLYHIELIIRDFLAHDDKDGAVQFMNDVEAKRGDDADIMARIAEFRGALFTSPEERIAFLKTKLDKTPDDTTILNELFDLYSEEGARDQAYDISAKLLALDPTSKTYRRVAKMRLGDGDSEEAIKLYEKSLTLDNGADAAREVHYNIGIAQQQEGRFSRARTEFRKTIKADPSYGSAYLAIGDLYVQAVQNCGSFEREDRTVYWLAADYFERAKAKDASVTSQANQRLRSIHRFFPDAEALFFKGWKEGASFKIDSSVGQCYAWINETTHVRKPK